MPSPNKRAEVQDPYYGTSAWKRLRHQCLRRDGFMCASPDCETPSRGKGGRLIAHHKIDRRKGGPDALDNLITLCPLCDNRGHAEKGVIGK